MLEIKKGVPIQSIYPGIYYAIFATPDDSLNNGKKNYYIVNVIDRNKKDGRVYSVETKVMDFSEILEGLGLKKREYIKVIKA